MNTESTSAAPARLPGASPRYWPWLVLFGAHSLLLEYTVRSRDWFFHYPYVDNVMHVGWGVVIALLIICFWRNSVKFVLTAIIIWQVGWETLEVTHDRIQSQPPHMQDHLWPDGLIDTGMDVLGACLALWLTRGGRQAANENIQHTKNS